MKLIKTEFIKQFKMIKLIKIVNETKLKNNRFKKKKIQCSKDEKIV